ncbi:hypothetical protein BUALT_Bualt17G0076000 [Buddleja alternifolia]|uniref:Reverse transcriptase domain-containing protein n=1 Tax=Buddleja alternifolia TaxID=168488 RepID=A0AAV6W6U0_9LAMI|nr:hypothetical protein BUALT_Bualt17G0076000 [Buddleja alternifolia]
MMNDLVSPNRSSFITGRNTHDNIFIVQEFVHGFRHMKSRKGGMMIKIDLEKASKPQVLWNGVPLQEFSMECGLRQGDPLFPYLFVLCMERLAYCIEEAVANKLWDPIPACKRGPFFSHMFFADDLILLVRATRKNTITIKVVMQKFCDASGLVINKNKSKMSFAQCTRRWDRRCISMEMGIACTDNLGRYLGVPIVHGRSTPRVYRELLDKVQARQTTWKAKLLNMAGRTTLVKYVMAALPVHTMQSAWLPQGTCNHLDYLSRAFLWATTANPRKMHLVKWKRVVKEDNGGLGIRTTRDKRCSSC